MLGHIGPVLRSGQFFGGYRLLENSSLNFASEWFTDRPQFKSHPNILMRRHVNFFIMSGQIIETACS